MRSIIPPTGLHDQGSELEGQLKGDGSLSRRTLLRQMLGLLAAAVGPQAAAQSFPPSASSSVMRGNSENNPLLVYIVPQFAAEDIFRIWSPVLKHLGEKLGLLFTLKIAHSIPEFEQLFLAGVPDIAYMNPYHAVMAKRAADYEPIIYDASHGLSGVLLVRHDARYKTLADLQKKEIAFPAPNAFGASLYLRARLMEKEHLQFSPRYVFTHSNVFRHVVAGQVAAGGAVRQTLELESSSLREQLRILYETPAFPSHPVVVHPRVPALLREKLRSAFLDIGREPHATSMLARIHMPQPHAANYQLYQPLEQLGLDKYVQLPAKK